MEHVNKVMNFLEEVVNHRKDMGNGNEQIILTTIIPGVPDIDAGDVKVAATELAELQRKVKRMEDMMAAIQERMNNMRKTDVMAGMLTAPKLRLITPEEKAELRLPFTGSASVISL